MENTGKSRWEGNEHWFKYDHHAVLEFIQSLQRILERHGVSKDKLGAIWKTFRIRVDNPICYNNLLLHIPHSSKAFPKGSRHSFADLDNEERLLVDYYTDELFVPSNETEHIKSVVFPYCRLFCDVERLINDPLEKDGLGIRYIREVPTGRGNSYTFREFNTKENAFSIYADYHAMVSKAIVSMNRHNEKLLLIDCHSFSELPNLLNSNPPDVDICIGYNDDDTCPDMVVIGNIVQYFKSLGYKVGINEPFSNSKTFNVPVKYSSVMIEVNKRLYMDEYVLEKTEGFEKLKQEIQGLYSILIN